MSPGARTARGLAYAAATLLAFPHPVGDREIDLGVVFAWLAPAALLAAVAGLAPRRALGVGFLAGLAAHAAVLHWIYVVTVRYGHAPPAVGVIAPVLLAGYIAAFTGVFSGLAAVVTRARVPALPFVLAALWTALDHARAFALTGFPWATLGYAQHANPALLGLAPVTGVYGLSFASVLGAAGARAWWLGRGRPEGSGPAGTRRAGAAAGLAVLALHGAGLLARPEALPEDAPRVAVAVLQGNVDQGEKWSPDRLERTLDNYAGLTRRAARRGARLVVWPETAVPAPLEALPPVRARVAALAREVGATLVVGVVGIDPPATPDGRPLLHDSALVVDPVGGPVARYDKAHLVPFGEYLPLRALLGRFVRAIATGSAGRDVTPGGGPRRLEVGLEVALDGGPAPRVVPLGIPICYELLFPHLVRRFVDDGAGLLLGITNDAWYGRTGAPLQFLVITALRSAETGVWMARAANTGVSAFIDPRGRVRERTALFERDVLVREIPVRPPGRRATFYVRHGDVFAGACWGLALAGLGTAWRRRRRPR